MDQSTASLNRQLANYSANSNSQQLDQRTTAAERRATIRLFVIRASGGLMAGMNHVLARSNRFLLCGLAAFVLVGTLFGANHVAGAEEANTRALVKRLGDPDPQVRRATAQQLLQQGLSAKAELQAGVDDPDAEVRWWCRRLLRTVLATDEKQRLDKFADSDGNIARPPAGWERFSALVGNDANTRTLFAQMCEDEPGLMASLEAGGDSANVALQLRFLEVYAAMSDGPSSSRQRPGVATVSTLLLYHAQRDLDLSYSLLNNPYWPQVIFSPDFKAAVESGKYEQTARKLLNEWVLHPSNEATLGRKLHYAFQYDLPAGLTAGLAILTRHPQIRGTYRGYAVGTVGKIGGMPYASVIADQLNDRGVCSQRVRFVNGERIYQTIETRDVALAWLVHLTGQDFDDYGLSNAKSEFAQLEKNRMRYMNISAMGFEDTDDRPAALERWQKWLEEHKLPPVPRDLEELPVVFDDGTTPANENEEVIYPESDRTALADMQQVDRLVGEQRYGEAAVLVSQMFQDRSQSLYRPNREVKLWQSVPLSLEGRLRQWPDDALQSYRLLLENQTQRDFQAALNKVDLTALREVAHRALFTPAGLRANYALGAYLRDHDLPLQATYYFQRARQLGPLAAMLEPEITLQQLASRRRAGVDELEPLLASLPRENEPRPVVAGQSISPNDQEQYDRSWLDASIRAMAPEHSESNWTLPRGSKLGWRVSPVQAVHRTQIWRARGENGLPLDQMVHELADKLREDRRGGMLTTFPIVVGERALFRSVIGLHCIDLAQGQTVWTVPTDDALEWFSRTPSDAWEEDRDELRRSVLERLWYNGLFGALSSDGERVFALEQMAMGPTIPGQVLEVGSDGKRRLDAGWLKRYNSLSARSVATGKLLWELGGTPGGNLPEDGVFFLSMPLPVGPSLFVVASDQRRIHLMELDAATGKVLHRMVVTPPGRTIALPMSAYHPFLTMQGRWRRQGLFLSQSEGIVVFPTSFRRFVAVDLATRQIRWTYEANREDDEDDGPRPGSYWEHQIQQANKLDPASRWRETTPLIVGDRVLLTPLGSDVLCCLDRDTGVLQWTAPRSGGMYVAAVTNEPGHQHVYVVGRQGMRALRLKDGENAWPDGELTWPGGAVPAGRGYFDNQHCLVPLSSGEIVTVALDHRQIVARCRVGQEAVGNLVGIPDGVLSLAPAGLSRFDLATERQAELRAALENQPRMPDLMKELAETYVEQGKIEEGAETCRAALKLRPDPELQRTLADALIDGLAQKVEPYSAWADELAPTLEDEQLRQRLERQQALALSRDGQLQQAAASLVRLYDRRDNDKEFLTVTPALEVRPQRWLLGQFTTLYEKASPQSRAELDELLREKLSEAETLNLDLVDGDSPAQVAARLKVAQQVSEAKPFLAERLLLIALRSPAITEEQENQALTNLAELYLQISRPEMLAALMQKFDKPVLQKFKSDPDVVPWLVDQFWKAGPVQKTSVERKDTMQRSYPVFLSTPAGSWQPIPTATCRIARRIEVFDPFGRQQLEFNLESPQSWKYDLSVMSHYQGIVDGQLMLIWIGGGVAMVDLSAEKRGEKQTVLWQHETAANEPDVDGAEKMLPPRLTKPRTHELPPAAYTSPVAMTGQTAFFQQDHLLVAVDVLTGEIQWKRDDTVPFSDLAAANGVVAVTSPGGEFATLYRAVDGRRVGNCPMPRLEDRLLTRSDRMVFWHHGSEPRVEMLRVSDGSVLWQQPLPEGTVVSVGMQDELVGSLDQDGKLKVWDLETGQTQLEEKVPVPENLESLHLLEYPNHVVAIANGLNNAANNAANAADEEMMLHTPIDGISIHGQVIGLDRQGGKLLWNHTLHNQAFTLFPLPEVPVLPFMAPLRKVDSQHREYDLQLDLLDIATGKFLHQERFEAATYYYNYVSYLYAITADPSSHHVTLRTRTKTFELDYSQR